MPGLWVAHCLAFDVISSGKTPSLAIEDATDAVALWLERQREPYCSTAPSIFWRYQEQIVGQGCAINYREIAPTDGDPDRVYVINLHMSFDTCEGIVSGFAGPEARGLVWSGSAEHRPYLMGD